MIFGQLYCHTTFVSMSEFASLTVSVAVFAILAEDLATGQIAAAKKIAEKRCAQTREEIAATA